ncbi:hypothetical protein LG307_14215 [Sutcliffiella horikoshii]|uniref:kinase n=1 Tax=Sutcliffiella horikoshii TaxID=79883 RepID=UPI0038504B3D
MLIYDYDISNLISLAKSDQRYILAIDGLSRSGKTTFVEHLSKHLKKEDTEFFIFHIDDYIVNRSQRYNTGFEEWYEYFYLQWDVEWLRNNFFEKHRDCNHVELPYYNNATDCYETRTIKLPKVGLFIIEGVFLQRHEWKDCYNQILFLDCPREKRFASESEATKLNREKFKKRYWKAEEYYTNTFSPLNNADIIIKT